MSRRKKLFWGVSFIIVLAVVVSVFLRSFSPGGGATAVETGSNGETPSGVASSPTPVVTVQPLPGGQPFIFINPGVVSQGDAVSVVGSNFDPGATIEFLIKQKEADLGKVVARTQADKTGSFNNVTINLPDSQPFGNFIILAREQGRSGNRTAESMGILQNNTNATVKLSAITGRVGDTVVVTAKGFAPREKINVYWNSLGTDPIATLQADAGGGIGQTPLQVPFGAPGNNTFFFEGVKSQTPVPALFVLLHRYPVVKPSSYSIRADNILSFSGKDFGPNELVVVYLGKPGGQPLATVQTDKKGNFANAAGFIVPFALKGKQTVYFVGSQSRAPTTLSFTVAPYMPNVQPSTYGGSPGTSITFYATGFARNEVVHIYTGADKNNPGQMVGCFQTDAKGNAGAVGSYMIPGNAQVGKMTFTLTGSKSGAVGTATIQVSAPLAPVQIPPQAPFTCPLDGKK
jgi:hypothetical protein